MGLGNDDRARRHLAVPACRIDKARRVEPPLASAHARDEVDRALAAVGDVGFDDQRRIGEMREQRNAVAVDDRLGGAPEREALDRVVAALGERVERAQRLDRAVLDLDPHRA